MSPDAVALAAVLAGEIQYRTWARGEGDALCSVQEASPERSLAYVRPVRRAARAASDAALEASVAWSGAVERAGRGSA